MGIHVGGMAFLTVAALTFATVAIAQEYPTKPVKIIVGNPAGGTPDLVARAFAQKLGELLGQPFVVENRPGAGATTATGQLARMPADGYNLLMGETGQLFVAPYVYKNLQYDTAKDFTPISMVATTAVLLVSNANSPVKSIPDLIREAKARPGKIDFGTSGVGSIHHIAMATFMEDAGIDLVHIPYKGSGQSVASILAGDVPVLATSGPAAGPHITAGKLIPLGVTSSFRLPGYPNVPPIGDFVKDFDFASETGFLAPAGLPANVLNKLSSAIRQVSQMPDLVEGFRKNGVIIKSTSPAEYTDSIRANLKKYERAVKIAKIPLAE